MQTHAAICDVCDQDIRGVRWKCAHCPDWDACDACHRRHQHTDGHLFVAVVFPLPPGHLLLSPYFSSASPSCHDDDDDEEEEDAPVHRHVVCDGCEGAIVGRRYRCLHCDFDLCQRCQAGWQAALLDGDDDSQPAVPARLFVDHSPLHLFAELRRPVASCPPPLPVFYSQPGAAKIAQLCALASQRVERRRRRQARRRQQQRAPAELLVRAMQPGDLRAVRDIEALSFPDMPYPRRVFVDGMRSASSLLLVVVAGAGALAGYAFVTAERPGHCRLASIAVHPRWRGGGVGRTLLDAVLRRLCAADVLSVDLHVAVTNAAAQALYASRGFRTVDYIDDYYWPAVKPACGDALVMQLAL